MNNKVVHGFYGCLRRTLFASRVAGIFPVVGLLSRDSKDTRCVWITPYSLFYMISIISIISATLGHLYDSLTSSRQFKVLGGLIVQCVASVALVFLVRFSWNWKDMINKIEAIEKSIPPLRDGDKIIRRINRIIIFIAIFGFGEHMTQTISYIRILILCCEQYNTVFRTEEYFVTNFGWFFDRMPYNFYTAVWIQLCKLQTVFVFFYIECLVLAVTLYLVYRFRNFNRLMKLQMKKCTQRTTWANIQTHYTRLTRLVLIIDSNINPFVFLSFLSHLVVMCKMIYDFIIYQKKITSNKFNPDCGIANSGDIWPVLNRFISAAFLMTRSLAISTLTSHLHSLSREPLNALHTLPASGYNVEVQRFMDQVYYSKISLSGMQFFYVSRGIILSMVSTIITYELVLLQLPVIYYLKE